MSERNRLLAVIGLVVIVLLTIVAIAVRLLRKPEVVVAPESEPTTAPQGGLEVSGSTAPSAAKPTTSGILSNPLLGAFPSFVEPEAVVGPAPVAELFAERYGSYSNQSSYQNLRDLLPLMTARYRAETEAKLAAPAPPPSEYLGVTSVKLSSKVVSLDEDAGRARVDVMLQQTKTAGTATPETAYATFIVRLNKSGSDWKIDSIVGE